jgi:Bacterial Ig-like domain
MVIKRHTKVNKIFLIIIFLLFLLFPLGCKEVDEDLPDKEAAIERLSENPPTVSSISPAADTTRISIDTNIVVTFNIPVVPSSVSIGSDPEICEGSIQLSDDDFLSCLAFSDEIVSSNNDRTFTLQPSADLTHFTSYKIRVTSDVQGLNGLVLQDEFSTTFRAIGNTGQITIYRTVSDVGNINVYVDNSSVGSLNWYYHNSLPADWCGKPSSRSLITLSLEEGSHNVQGSGNGYSRSYSVTIRPYQCTMLELQ